jgi:hypothetical protein
MQRKKSNASEWTKKTMGLPTNHREKINYYRPGLDVVEAAHEVVSRVEDERPLPTAPQRIHKGFLVRSFPICFRDLMMAKHKSQKRNKKKNYQIASSKVQYSRKIANRKSKHCATRKPKNCAKGPTVCQ